MKNVRVLLFGFLVLLMGLMTVNCFAETYEIPVGSISDHSDASIEGSIAWYMAQYGGSNTYNLSSSATYYCNNTLFVPGSATLGEKSGVSATIRCSNSWVIDGSDVLVILNENWACVRDLELHGNWKPKHLVYAGFKTGVSVRSCTVHKSRKVTKAHLIIFQKCNRI